jgi:hypothetical protein
MLQYSDKDPGRSPQEAARYSEHENHEPWQPEKHIKTSTNPARIKDRAAHESSQRSGGGFTEQDYSSTHGTKTAGERIEQKCSASPSPA